MHTVFGDFGDVRYVGCRHAAFASWWRAPVYGAETRGEYLFAEPLQARAVRALLTVDDAAAVLGGDDMLVLNVPLTMQRKHIDKAVDRLLRQHMGKLQKGKQVRNPKHSAALYSLNKSVLPTTLKKAFDVYDLHSGALAAGDKHSNDAVARLTGVAVEQKSVDKHAEYTEHERNRVLSATISLHYNDAKNMIDNAAAGCFA